MSRRKKTAKSSGNRFKESPFRKLKGLAVGEPQNPSDTGRSAPEKPCDMPDEDFSAAMSRLGVTPLSDDRELRNPAETVPHERTEVAGEQPPADDQALFLDALGEMQVRFTEQDSEDSGPAAVPRRMKQLKQGRLEPEATLDLHGVARHEAVARLNFFLQNGERQGWRTVLVVTGKGLHAPDGISVIRREIEEYLSDPGHRLVLEWSRAPSRYGGAGALVLFLRKK